jgi:SpoVK/Ycf46/Vps4 family AAA+-type ATPase
VYGFVLRTRRWATFDIERLKEIPRNEEGWKDLVIDPYIKQTVLALVTNHERSSSRENIINGALSSVDLVQGKGRGLIILLHGEPGVGKTSTAECVAALTGRPLFPITCGDIGDKAETVEMNLEKNFQLARKWGCVLLLDEAEYVLTFGFG